VDQTGCPSEPQNQRDATLVALGGNANRVILSTSRREIHAARLVVLVGSQTADRGTTWASDLTSCTKPRRGGRAVTLDAGVVAGAGRYCWHGVARRWGPRSYSC
jgi:hypothetical protein